MTQQHSAALLDAALGVDPRFATPPNCTRCGCEFGVEVIWRRVFESSLGLALAALCDGCSKALPRGSAAESELRVTLERQTLAAAAPQGRA